MTMANQQLSLSDQWKSIKPVWRICIAILIAQFVGMGFGVALRPVGETFFNLWYGGVYATPIGFIAGLAWQLVFVPGSLMQHRLVILFLGCLSIFLPLFGYLTQDTWSLGSAR